ncbi:MAG: hypothetical protein FWE20_10290 [Defluviitaleaceae bacterium]|nr:hypothetical protein [Defluviitaleaceae bacterium]
MDKHVFIVAKIFASHNQRIDVALKTIADAKLIGSDAVDFLESLGNPICKIASFELVDTKLVVHAALKTSSCSCQSEDCEDEIGESAVVCRAERNDDMTTLRYNRLRLKHGRRGRLPPG